MTGPDELKSRSVLSKSLKLDAVKKSSRASDPGASFSMDSEKSVAPLFEPLPVVTYRLPLASKAGAAPDIHTEAAVPFGLLLKTPIRASVVASKLIIQP